MIDLQGIKRLLVDQSPIGNPPRIHVDDRNRSRIVQIRPANLQINHLPTVAELTRSTPFRPELVASRARCEGLPRVRDLFIIATPLNMFDDHRIPTQLEAAVEAVSREIADLVGVLASEPPSSSSSAIAAVESVGRLMDAARVHVLQNGGAVCDWELLMTMGLSRCLAG